MRTTKSSPVQMWISGQLQNPCGLELSADDMEYYGVEGVVHDDRDGSGSRPIVYPLSGVVSEQCL